MIPAGTTTRADRERAEYWLDVVAELHGQPLRTLPCDRLCAALTATFTATATADHRRAPTGVVQRVSAPGSTPDRWREVNELARTRAESDVPLLRWYLITGDARAQHSGAVPVGLCSRSNYRRWLETVRPLAVDQQLAIPLAHTPDRHHSLVVGRREPFNGDDVRFARRLQGLLQGLARQTEALDRALPAETAPGAEVAVGEVLTEIGLTPREIAVLDLVARGATAETAGRVLMISPRTVHKHLEHAYAKLGVRDRVSAVLRARNLGLVGDRKRLSRPVRTG